MCWVTELGNQMQTDWESTMIYRSRDSVYRLTGSWVRQGPTSGRRFPSGQTNLEGQGRQVISRQQIRYKYKNGRNSLAWGRWKLEQWIWAGKRDWGAEMGEEVRVRGMRWLRARRKWQDLEWKEKRQKAEGPGKVEMWLKRDRGRTVGLGSTEAEADTVIISLTSNSPPYVRVNYFHASEHLLILNI